MSTVVSLSIKCHSSPWRIWRSATKGHGRWRAFGKREKWERRCLSSESDSSNVLESFEVNCGSLGGISVDIYNSHHLNDPSSPLVIYLPSEGASSRPTKSQVPALLQGLPINAAVAQIKYRWNIPLSPADASNDSQKGVASIKPLSSSPDYNIYAFPTPLHDTLSAYDFLTTTYLPHFSRRLPSLPSPPQTPTRNQTQRPVILSGSFLGGTIATSLALTSTYAASKKSDVFYVAGLIAHDAVCDWTDVAARRNPAQIQENNSTVDQLQGDANHGAWTTQTLHDLKTRLFASPGGAFDSFASPVLFFHTPGFVVPSIWPGTQIEAPNDRYSTSIDDQYDVSSEYLTAADVAGDGERGEAELIGSNPPKATTTTTNASPKKPTQKPDLGPEIARTSYLKFPPAVSASTSSYSRFGGSSASLQEQLKIPRSLFLYSTDPSAGGDEVPKVKSKSVKAAMVAGQVTPEKQAKEMARLMRRSMLMYELKDRGMGDQGFDAQEVANGRVQILAVDGEQFVGEKIQEWLEDCLE